MNPVDSLHHRLANRLSTPPKLGQSLAPLTSLKAGGQAALWAQVCGLEELEFVLEAAAACGVPWFLLGKGSNLVCSGATYPGLLLQLAGDFAAVQQNQGQLTAGAAAQDGHVARMARKAGLSGLEWLVTVPGTLGGAVYMNAGAHKSEIKDFLTHVEVYRPGQGVVRLAAEDCHFAYRQSRFQQGNELILAACFSLPSSDPRLIKETELRWVNLRRETQPVGIKTFGSMFRNPPGEAAWALIEAAGLKGTHIGNFRINLKHANFMENLGSGNPKGLLELIKRVQTEVHRQSGIHLQLEGQFFPQLTDDCTY